jgi:predicted esterase
MRSGKFGGAITRPADHAADKEYSRPHFESLLVERHARVALVGDPATASEVWLILHGYGMTAQGILHWFRAAAKPGRAMVAPEGLSRFYQKSKGLRTVGASWMTREDRENEILDQNGYLEQVASRWLVGSDGHLPQIHVHGFSQGVATACRWVAATATPVHRLVCWGSPTPGDVPSEQLAARLGGSPLNLAIGESDRFFSPDVVAADAARRREEGLAVNLVRFDGGHGIDREVLADFSG